MDKKDAKVKFVFSDTGKSIIDMTLPDGTSEVRFPANQKGLERVSLIACGKTFYGVKRIYLPDGITKFHVKNSQFPDLEEIYGPRVSSPYSSNGRGDFFLFDKETKTFFDVTDSFIHLTNVFDTKTTGPYNSQALCKAFTQAHAYDDIDAYAFEGTKFSNVELWGTLNISEKAFDGSRFKKLNKDKTLFTVKEGNCEALLAVNNDAPVDAMYLANLKTGRSPSFSTKLFGPITMSVGKDVPCRFLSNSIAKSVRTIRIEKNFKLTNDNSIIFYRHPRVKSVEVAEGSMYCVIDGVLYSKDKKTLLYYPPEREGEKYTIPDGVERIFSNAFANTKNLREISFPDSICLIDEQAFLGARFETFKVPPALLNQDERWMIVSTINRLIIGSNATATTPFRAANNAALNTFVEDGVKYVGQSGLYAADKEWCGVRPDCIGTYDSQDDKNQAKQGGVAEITLPKSMIAISPKAITYAGNNGGHIINLNAYSHTLNLVSAAFNAMAASPQNSPAYVSINLVDKGGMIPVASCMSKENVDNINEDLNGGKDYLDVLDEALAAIKIASFRGEIALSMLPDADEKAKEVLEKHLKKASSYCVKAFMETKDVAKLISITKQGFCSQKTLQYILSNADKDTMCELVTIVSEQMKRREKRISL